MKATVHLRRLGCGIVGLPNIGKSTLFNAMTSSNLAKVGNYPFCTIHANRGKAITYDARLRTLAAFSGAQKIVDVEVDVTDVAGLIEGASKGEGMGNAFLADIRGVSLILHTVRCFADDRNGFDAPDPSKAIHTIDNELILSDCAVVEKYVGKVKKTMKPGSKELVFAERLLDFLFEGKSARDFSCKDVQETGWLHGKELGLLSVKPVLYILNVDERSMKEGNAYSKEVEAAKGTDRCLRVCCSVESDVSQMDREERLSFLKEYGRDHPAVEDVSFRAHSLLDLVSFFTVGPQMAHAWSVPRNATVRTAAGAIHTDFETHFRKAKVMAWSEFVTHKSLKDAEAAMNVVQEDHVIADGDVMIVAHGAQRNA